MRALSESLAESSTSSAFEVIDDSIVTIGITGTWDGMTATVQWSPDNSTWTDFTSGGADVTMSATENLLSIEVGGGLWFRLTTDADSSNAGSINIYVGGQGVQF